MWLLGTSHLIIMERNQIILPHSASNQSTRTFQFASSEATFDAMYPSVFTENMQELVEAWIESIFILEYRVWSQLPYELAILILGTQAE